MIYQKTLTVDSDTAAVIEEYLESGGQSEDETISLTAVFPDEMEVDVKCCGSQDGAFWTEAVLFRNGRELCCTEPADEFFDEWEIEHNGDRYIVNVVCEETLCCAVHDSRGTAKKGVL